MEIIRRRQLTIKSDKLLKKAHNECCIHRCYWHSIRYRWRFECGTLVSICKVRMHIIMCIYYNIIKYYVIPWVWFSFYFKCIGLTKCLRIPRKNQHNYIFGHMQFERLGHPVKCTYVQQTVFVWLNVANIFLTYYTSIK